MGLAEAILAERDHPRCDLFWNNEILNTLRLDRAGLLESYEPPIAREYPAADRSPNGTWYGFAARARILVVNTNLVPEAERPRSIAELADPKWCGRAGIAKPLFGTTATHAACLFAAWGEDRAKEFFHRLKQNDVRVLSGNKQVALSVAGRAVGLRSDGHGRRLEEVENGQSVAIVFPDQGEAGFGTLVIPNTVAIIKGGPNPAAARRLVRYLLSQEVETRLADGPSAQIPLHPSLRLPPAPGDPEGFQENEGRF